MTNISKSSTYKMAAKTSWHRYGTKLRHCHPVYRRLRHMKSLKSLTLDVIYRMFTFGLRYTDTQTNRHRQTQTNRQTDRKTDRHRGLTERETVSDIIAPQTASINILYAKVVNSEGLAYGLVSGLPLSQQCTSDIHKVKWRHRISSMVTKRSPFCGYDMT